MRDFRSKMAALARVLVFLFFLALPLAGLIRTGEAASAGHNAQAQATAEHTEEGAHHKKFNLSEELFKFINLLIVIAILYKLAAKPVRDFLNDRREGIRRALIESEKARAEAEKLLEEQRAKVADLEAELARMREMGKNEREDMRVRLDAEREAQVERLLAQAKNTIGLEENRAVTELRNEAARLALDLAEQMLKQELKPEDQERFATRYVEELQTRNGGIL